MNIQATAPAIVDPAEMSDSDIDNTIPIEAWNTVLFEKFCRFRYVLSHGLSGHSEEFFRRIRREGACSMSVVVSATRPGTLRHR
jgi:hypothetical protein